MLYSPAISMVNDKEKWIRVLTRQQTIKGTKTELADIRIMILYANHIIIILKYHVRNSEFKATLHLGFSNFNILRTINISIRNGM